MKQQEILNHISIINVKNKLGLKEVCSIGNIIYVRCPFCNSLKGEMKLNIQNNSYICKDCEERGYAISLYAKCKNINNKQAYRKLLEEPANLKSNVEITVNNSKKDIEELDNVYREFLSLLNLDTKHQIKLKNLGFLSNEIESIGFKTIPIKENEKIIICSKLLELGYELKGIPRILSKFKF